LAGEPPYQGNFKGTLFTRWLAGNLGRNLGISYSAVVTLPEHVTSGVEAQV
jgi:hypothetical protein